MADLRIYAPGTNIFKGPYDVSFNLASATPQAYFLFESLRRTNETGQRNYRAARLEGDRFNLQFERIDFIRRFFGFHPSKDVAAKLLSMSDREDERTFQILNWFKGLDQEVIFAYLCQSESFLGRGKRDSTRYALAVGKKDTAKLNAKLNNGVFMRANALRRPFDLPVCTPFTGAPSEHEFTRPFKRNVDLYEIQDIIAQGDNPVIICERTWGAGITFPLYDLGEIDFFPFKTQAEFDEHHADENIDLVNLFTRDMELRSR